MNADATRVGLIGLGLMGQGFARCLGDAGLRPTGHDIAETRRTEAAALGVTIADSAAAVTAASDIVLVSVTTTQAVEQAVFAAGGVAESAGPGKVLVDLSTTEVAATRAMAERLADTGMAWVDAPVSGGPEAAATGSLAIMAGGDQAAIAQVEPLMRRLAATFTHFGPVGAGQVAKMVNQILVLNNYVVLAEALALAEAGGIDAAKLPDALAAGHAGSNLLKALFPRLIERDFEPRGYARQILKDLDAVQALAKQLATPVPMSGQAGTLFRILAAKGHGELDGAAILKLYDPDARL